MAEFCSCGSLIIHGNCTKKGCQFHKNSLVDPATYAQIEYIKSLLAQTDSDMEVNFDVIAKSEASRLIDELLKQKELQ
ncbi:DUF3072 domain-containing protein [Ruminiclostridium cellulolyticum]|uniref:Uncharacterized protein n=1 Tax=Ruminiclostridium cellulolyticum (strain ATCC 35319 / DSM 5812 / JCM 6584 / H10) TaxID=394503 RepID=B8I923_RUMCH|nr:DUF3072 domain-containing protein [Ruminiclostridium cellulolyticum]ACL77355.1 hypothetical protein Ccel_3063 [Ruminiclostridium cellulolyticum H10]